MSKLKKATAAAHLGVMLKVLVILVVAYSLEGTRKPVTPKPMFVIDQAFIEEAQDTGSTQLRPEVAPSLVSLVSSHDLNLDVTVFGDSAELALGRAATVAQLLQSLGIPTSAVRVRATWGRSETSPDERNSLIAVKRSGSAS